MSSDIVKPKTTFGDTIRFTPYAWKKLLYMRDCGDTEVAGYGVTGTDDPLLVTDFVLIKQECTSVTFDLDPGDGAEFMETMMDQGLMPWQCSNILIHTHPGNSSSPSPTDEDNFKEAFSHPDWAIMFIIAQDNSSYCRLKINAGPGAVKHLKTAIDWNTTFGGTDTQAWDNEYGSKVSEALPMFGMTGLEGLAENAASFQGSTWWDDEHKKWIDFDELEKAQMAEEDAQDSNLEDIDCHWNEDGDVEYWSEIEEDWYVYDPIKGRWYKVDDDNKVMAADKPPTGSGAVVEWATEYANERSAILAEVKE